MTELTAEIITAKHGAQAEAHGRRRRLQRDLRDAREKLTSNTGLNRAFSYDLAKQFAQARLNAAIALVIFAVAIGGALLRWLPAGVIMCWLAGVMMLLALMTGSCRAFLAADFKTINLPRWRLRFAVLEGLYCTAWGGLAFVALFNSDETFRTLLAMAMLMAGATSAMLSAAIPAVAHSGLLPIGLGIIALFRPGNDMGSAVVIISAASAITLFVMLSRKLFATAVETLEYRAEKDILIVELEQQTSKSDESRLLAEESNLAKSKFLATMSHELRTPLNAILGFSEVMKNEVFGPHANASYKEYAGDIHASGQHLLNLINEILDLSRIEAGRYELQEEAVDLVDIVDDCVHMQTIRAKGRSQTVRTLFEENLPRLWADERALRQVALNLLSNAIKFTPAGGEITIKVGWTASGGQYLSIRDTGPGIPENEIPIVLSSFGRGKGAIKAAQEGSGLGLPIVQNLVDLHGGAFALKSKVREGTEVIVTIPPERVMEALKAVASRAVIPASLRNRAA